MFEECFVESRRSRSAKKPVTVALSIAVHSCVVGALILVPLFQLQVLPQIESDPPLPPFRMPKGIQVITVGPSGTGASHGPSSARPLTAPPTIPSTIEFSADVGQPDIAGTVGFGSPSSGNNISAPFGLPIGDGGPSIAPPPDKPAPPLPPPLPPAQPVYKSPQRVGGDVQQAKLLEHPNPIYPRLAVTTRVQGAVVLEAVITKEGNVDSVRVVSGHFLLVQAAIDAVRQWRYRPTLLNGQPVEVITTVSVNFILQ